MKYEIQFNGRTYEVEVELAKPMTVGEFQTYAPAAPAASAAPAAPKADELEVPEFVQMMQSAPKQPAQEPSRAVAEDAQPAPSKKKDPFDDILSMFRDKR